MRNAKRRRPGVATCIVACIWGGFVAGEAAAATRGAVAAMYQQAGRLAVTAEEAERALARAGFAQRRDILAGLDALRPRAAGALDAGVATPTRSELPR